jgi:hypothetical protein
MISGKAIELLKTFNGTEFKEFGLFVSSPFFNRENVLINLRYTQKNYPSFDGRNFVKEKVLKSCTPKYIMMHNAEYSFGYA